MSLRKKIFISFIISAAIMAALAGFEHLNFRIIKKEIRFLELTDSVRSKSLQLRRHEKNYFLYSPAKAVEESAAIHKYLDELDVLLERPLPYADAEVLGRLHALVREYRSGFDAIELLLTSVTRELRALKRGHGDHAEFFPLIESQVYDRPFQAAEFVETVFHLPANHRLVVGLGGLSVRIAELRKSGEGIINVSKELDRAAREKVERGISASQYAMAIIFPLFLITGMALLFLISRNIVHRLALLRDVVEKTAKGTFAHVDAPEQQWGRDEVGTLIRKFDEMEHQLEERAAEIRRKNEELIQVKKLAAIGTLAAGVAHELNNPLNNIHLSTQVLSRELGDDAPPAIKEVASDILGQTVRVKKIVSDLLEFARGREPVMRECDLNALITGAYARTRSGRPGVMVRFNLNSDPSDVHLKADPEQLEQVFINLFTNAIDAMRGEGRLAVDVAATSETVTVKVSDNGMGMPEASLEKVFEPFYTTKHTGTGLGLAIVFSIIKKHYGEISVTSSEGRGTTFAISLPRSM